jgi:hypothetical protein
MRKRFQELGIEIYARLGMLVRNGNTARTVAASA